MQHWICIESFFQERNFNATHVVRKSLKVRKMAHRKSGEKGSSVWIAVLIEPSATIKLGTGIVRTGWTTTAGALSSKS
jgi:hypothetical protein